MDGTATRASGDVAAEARTPRLAAVVLSKEGATSIVSGFVVPDSKEGVCGASAGDPEATAVTVCAVQDDQDFLEVVLPDASSTRRRHLRQPD